MDGDGDGDRNVRRKLSDDKIEEVDRLRDLPTCLIFEVFLKLPTKDLVKTSVLSTRWRYLWRYVPALNLNTDDFPKLNDCVSFVDKFLGFNNESSLKYFRLKYNATNHQEPDTDDTASVTRWITIAVNRKVQHLYVWYICRKTELELPSIVYTCESLVSLELSGLTMPSPKLVSLPNLKSLFIPNAKFPNDFAFEMLVSGCLVLENLLLSPNNVKVLRVCSQSLQRFFLSRRINPLIEDGLVVAIDAPRLECLILNDRSTSSFIINRSASLFLVSTKITFNMSIIERRLFIPNDNLPKRNMILDFLIGISSVKALSISSCTLEVISRFEGLLPLFCNLSFLSVEFYSYIWDDGLPIFLERCPNLKYLSMRICEGNDFVGIPIVHGSRRFPTYLEDVKIEKPMIVDEPTEMRLAGYILENSTILKKFTFCLDDSRKNEESVILEKLLAIPRRSSSCQIVVL